MDTLTYQLDPEVAEDFDGGLLHVGNGDFDLAEQLGKGDGSITIEAGDEQLAALLNAVPVLEPADTPDPVVFVVNRFERASDDALRSLAVARGLGTDDVVADASREVLEDRLQRTLGMHQDQIRSELAIEATVSSRLSKAQLLKTARELGVDVPSNADKADIVELIRNPPTTDQVSGNDDAASEGGDQR